MSKSLAKQYIEDFRKHFAAGIEGIVRAGECYVAAIDENPHFADQFRNEFADSIPASAWGQFEAVGRKWMHPKLIMGGMSDPKKSALIKRLPYSTQERVFNRERFDLLTASGDTLQIDMLEATSDQVKQLCDGSAIRSISAQKAWLEATNTVTVERAETMPYTVRDGKVSFRRGVVLTRQELKRLLQDM